MSKWNFSSVLRFGRLLDVVLPMLIFAVVFAGASYVVFSGNSRDEIAARVERQLLQNSLSNPNWRLADGVGPVVISETNQDVVNLDNNDHPSLKALPLDRYAEVLKIVLAAKPKFVVLSWLPAAHGTEAETFQQMLAVLKEKPANIDVLIPYPIYEIGDLPTVFRENANVLEGDDCGFEVNSLCAFNPAWKNWIVQNVMDRSGPAPRNNGFAGAEVVTNLPHIRASLVLNLPAQNSLKELSFQDVSVLDFDSSMLAGRAVFIGSAARQKFAVRADSNLVRRVRTPITGESASIEDGLPFHTWLAGISAMIEQRQLVVVSHEWVSNSLTVLISLLILVLLWRVGTGGALAFFIVFAISYPFLNVIFVRYLNIYIPMFEVIYFGLITFLLVGFGRLSYQVNNKWMVFQNRHHFQEIAELKTNFIGLVSHNLNTPIARMQGLNDLLLSNPETASSSESLRFVNQDIARLQLAVRSVLIATAAEDLSLSKSSLTIQRLVEEVHGSVGVLCRRLGIVANFELSLSEDDQGFAFESFAFDVRAISFSLVAMAALSQELFKSAPLKVVFQMTTRPEGDRLVPVILTQLPDGIAVELFQMLHSLNHFDTDSSNDLQFFLRLLQTLVVQVAYATGGPSAKAADFPANLVVQGNLLEWHLFG
jgi:signal transduction histidine kinase